VSERPVYATPAVTRSLLVLSMAEELVRDSRWPYRQAEVRMQGQVQPDVWDAVLYGSDGVSPIDKVGRGEVHVAIINPGQLLALAARGSAPFGEPIPLRTITVIPSVDQLGLAVAANAGITRLEEIREKRYPLRIAIRGGRTDHCLHPIIDHVLEAAGTSLDDIRSWGGSVNYDPYPPNVRGVERGERDAVFDEALGVWTPKAFELGMRFLPIDGEVKQRLVAMGYTPAVMAKSEYRGLPEDVPTLDFSGWPVYTHASVSDEIVTGFCQGIDAIKDRIPWQGEGPLPLDRMCSNTPEAPLTVPLHPAAERYWREHGYLR
jgi:TRAP-type uncharacterized transport system substrate-binding protein